LGSREQLLEIRHRLLSGLPTAGSLCREQIVTGEMSKAKGVLPAEFRIERRPEQRIEYVRIRGLGVGKLSDVDVEIVVQKHLSGEFTDSHYGQPSTDPDGFEIRFEMACDPDRKRITVGGEGLDFECEL
jgi:hypothetical protein